VKNASREKKMQFLRSKGIRDSDIEALLGQSEDGSDSSSQVSGIALRPKFCCPPPASTHMLTVELPVLCRMNPPRHIAHRPYLPHKTQHCSVQRAIARPSLHTRSSLSSQNGQLRSSPGQASSTPCMPLLAYRPSCMERANT
jgi:hypothetical protein